ncbi:MAG TPA: hypothetical protein VG651_11505 [Stellaceae bacterium]|nr:hypothetical protein [Stellaceae bacterium]
MKAAVFVRRSGAFGLGHTGWMFQHADATFNDGSVENGSGEPVVPPGKTDFWSETVADPGPPMRRHGYDEFKLLEVDPAAPLEAEATVAWVAQQPYLVLGRNCMDDTYDVLRSFGAKGLPLPVFRLAPNFWYDTIDAVSHPIAQAGPPLLGAAAPVMPARPAAPAPAAAVRPPWRTAGTPEWLEFQRAIHRDVIGRNTVW